MNWVVDCSIALAWCLPDESSLAADRFIRNAGSEGELLVPALWWYELANGLTIAVRRKRITEADARSAFDLLARLPLSTDGTPDSAVALRIHSLAERHKLTAYDAAYLELAVRANAGLASVDDDLLAAARRSGLRIAAAR